jgi:hypothetical protein
MLSEIQIVVKQFFSVEKRYSRCVANNTDLHKKIIL